MQGCIDRREAIDFAANKQSDERKARELMLTALNDKYKGLRIYTIQRLNIQNDSAKMIYEPILADLAKNDLSSLVRAGAIQSLGRFKKDEYKELFINSINDSSYSVAGNALLALGSIDSAAALERAGNLSSQHVKGGLSRAISNTLYMYAGEGEFYKLSAKFDSLSFGSEKLMLLQPFSNYLKRIKNTDNFKKGIDMIVRFRDTIPDEYVQQFQSYFNGMILNGLATSKQSMGLTNQADYVKSKIISTTSQ
jgi:aminopeptidase N